MQKNENFNLLCSSHYEAQLMCIDKTCTKPALICLNNQCPCNYNHNRCPSIRINNLNDMFYKLDVKNKNFFEVTVEYCNIMIKQLVILREQMLCKLQNDNFVFDGDQGRLYEALRNGRVNNITKELILSVQESIIKKQKAIDYEIKLKSHKQKLKKIVDQLENITKKVVQLHQREKVPLKFSQTLHHQNINIVNDNIIKLSNNSQVLNDQSKFCLMEPSIQDRSDKKQIFRFKVINTKDKVMAFGLCHRETAIKNRFGWVSYIGGGYYYIRGYDGNSVSHAYQNQNKTQTKIKSIDKGQIVEIIFDQKQQIFTVTNVSKNQSAVLKVNIQADNPLHIVILLYDKGDEIEYLGEVSPN